MLLSTFTDPRDGKEYKTAKISNQIWMAENLNYNAPGSKCYDNNPKNALKYGRLYDWQTAKKANPSGWHLPTDEEWQILVDFVGGNDVAGKSLKAKNGWYKDGNGTDDYGFAALPGGNCYPNGNFCDVGSFGIWWSATEDNSGYAYLRYMGWGHSNVIYDNNDKIELVSVRCVQD
jgi:uncharacterized protein (TIGR02145 family)